MRRLLLLCATLALSAAALPAAAAAQSSQFGVRGPGIPGRPFSARALATGGSFGLFDPTSSLTPASLTGLGTVTAVFTGLQNYRSSTNPAGSAAARDTRFPQVLVGGPVPGVPLWLAASYSNYATRDFSLATTGSTVIRGSTVATTDTLVSQGGIGDMALSAAYVLPGNWTVSAAFHNLTGSNRIQLDRTFADSAYLPVSQRAEVSYAGVGVAVGVTKQFSPAFGVALMARSDGRLRINRDSTLVTRVDAPYALAAGMRLRPTARLELAAQGRVQTWRDANRQLLEQGGTGADNSWEVAFGGEYARSAAEPAHLPIRFGARIGRLPFPLAIGAEQPRELGLSLGSGLGFASDQRGIDRARLDLGLEYVRRTAGPSNSERAWQLSVGVMVRP